MTESMERAGVSRRLFLGGVGVTAGGLMVASGPVLWQQAAKADTVTAEQVHLTFGEDPAREVVVSWVTPTSVSNPAVMVGTPHGGFGRRIAAETRTYTDSNNGIETIAQHARIEGLHPDTDYVYQIVSDGETQLSSAFRTAPEGRVPFRFTSVGDIACGDTAFSKASLNAVATAASVELVQPGRAPGQRRPVLRQLQPAVPAPGLGGVLRQHAALGREPAVDADPGQPRERARQRPAGLPVLPDPLRPAEERLRATSRATGTSSRSARCCSSCWTTMTSATRSTPAPT